MARGTRFDVECLEGRALLSGITYSVTTDQPVYQVGQTIQLTFTETNTGDQPALVGVQSADFTIENGTGVIWQSNPSAAGQAAVPEELQPGQSITQTASWDGTTPFTELGEPGQTLNINQWGTFSVSNINAPTGVAATFQITDPIAITMTTDQSVYQIGQPIVATFTETNTSDQSLTLPDPGSTAITFWHDTEQVQFASYIPGGAIPPTMMLAAGATDSVTVTWNGIPASGPDDEANLTGTFYAAYGPENDPVQYTAEFQIAAPTTWDVASSIATDQSTYEVGQPVNITYTETNAGDQPIEVVVGQDTFQVTQNGSIVWLSGGGGGIGDAWATLSPGQSITQTTAWNDTKNGGESAGTGTFVVTNLVDPNASTATFQVVAPPGQDSGTSNHTTSATGSTSSESTNPVAATTAVSSTLNTNHKVYRVGDSVRITLKLRDGGATEAALQTARAGERITILDGSRVVWEATRRVGTSRASIEPGQTVKLSTVWDGRTNQAGVGKLRPGTYTIDVTDGIYSGETVVRIGC